MHATRCTIASALCAGLLVAAAARAATITTLAKSGDADAAGTKLASFDSAVASSRTRVAFRGITQALMTKNGTTFAVIAKTGDALPAPLSGTYNGFFDPHINDSGSIVFRAGMNAVSSDLGLFFFNGTTFSTIVTRPTAIVKFPPDINSAGDVVYEDSNTTLFLWTGGSSVPIVAVGAAVPGGGTIASLGRFPVMNDSDVVAFEAQVSGAGDGIFTWDPINGIVTVAQTGAPSPVGGTYGSFNNNQAVAINNASGGQVAFTANLTGSPADGVFRYTPGPVTIKIAATGDLVGVDTLTNFDDEYVGINGSGTVAFEGRFGSTRRLAQGSGGALTGLGVVPSNAHDFGPRLSTTGRIVWSHSGDIQEYDGAITTVVTDTDVTPFGTGLSAREPCINNGNVIAFRALRPAIHELSRGTAEPILQKGDPSPVSGTIGSLVEHFFKGNLAISATDTGGALIVRNTNAGLVKVVANGDASPLGGTLDLSPLLDDVHEFAVKGSKVLFHSLVTGGSATEAICRATSNGTIQTVAKVGDPAGGALILDFTQVWASGSKAVFKADLDNTTSGLFIAAAGQPATTIALVGDSAPDTGGETFASIGNVATGGSSVAFAADLAGGVATTGLFSWKNGTLTKVVLEGDTTPLGGTFFAFLDTDTASIATGGGGSAFVAGVNGGSSAEGIFLFRRGAISTIVKVADATPLGGTFEALDLGEPLTLLGTTVVFEGNLSGAGAALGLFTARP